MLQTPKVSRLNVANDSVEAKKAERWISRPSKNGMPCPCCHVPGKSCGEMSRPAWKGGPISSTGKLQVTLEASKPIMFCESSSGQGTILIGDPLANRFYIRNSMLHHVPSLQWPWKKTPVLAVDDSMASPIVLLMLPKLRE